MMSKKKPAKSKIVYVSLGADPEEGESVAGLIIYATGYSKKKTNWYRHEIDLETLEMNAAMYDYMVLEGIGCYIG